MSWDAIAAVASLITALVIAASAVAAVRQVNQLSRAAQLDGTMRIFAHFIDPEFVKARNFVFCELKDKLSDPSFTDELRFYKKVDLVRHPEYRVLLFLQFVGTLVKNGLVDGPGVYEFAQYSIVKSWEVLEPVVRLQRESLKNPYMWGGADFLYESTKRWLEEEAQRRHIVDSETGELFHVEQLR